MADLLRFILASEANHELVKAIFYVIVRTACHENFNAACKARSGGVESVQRFNEGQSILLFAFVESV